MKVIEGFGAQETLNSLKACAQRINGNGVIIKPFVDLDFTFFSCALNAKGSKRMMSALDWKYTKCVPD